MNFLAIKVTLTHFWGLVTFINKKFLETDYPRSRAIEVFRRFHPDYHREPKLCILPHPELPKMPVLTSPKER